MKSINLPTFVKWAGGKTQLLEQFEPFYPKNIERYLEPFVGSGAVFFHIKQIKKPDYCMISDNNKDLINLYSIVRDKPNKLIDLLKDYKKNHKANSKKYYYKQREKFNKTKDKLIKSALLIYLNKTCFNGLYRVNSKGEFNVPMGSYKNPAILQEWKIKEASILLQDVEIKKMNFKKILNYAEQGDFVYFDPPYYPLSPTSSFTSYHKDSFLEKEQKQLSQVFQELDKRGCFVMLSNSDSPLIHKLYNKYEEKGFLYLVQANRMISCNGNGRGAINEVLVTNYKPLQKQKKLELAVK